MAKKTKCPKCGGTSWATCTTDTSFRQRGPLVTVKCWSGRGRRGGCPFEVPITRQDIIACAVEAAEKAKGGANV